MRSELCAFGTSSLVRVGVQSFDRQTEGSGDSFMREEGPYWYTGVTNLVKVILDSVSWARKWTGRGRTFALSVWLLQRWVQQEVREQ